jgi:acyl phosphate:glycerol-3-phosphate acyltransferase
VVFVALILIVIAGYLLGSVPFGFLIAQYHGIDIRTVGSGATGGTNVLRTVGVRAAIATALGDLLKGTVAGYLGLRLGGEWGYVSGVFAAMVGHSYPVWLGFRGGKSVATGAGGMLLLHPLLVLTGIAAALLAVWPTRWVSLGSLTGATVICLWLLLYGSVPESAFAIAAYLIVFWRHRENVRRMLAGTENRLGQRAVTLKTGTEN